MLFTQITDDRLCLIKIVFVRNREGKVDATEILFRIVDDRSGRKRTVRKINDLVVPRTKTRRRHTNILNRSRISARFDKVVDAERTGDENERTAREVGNCAVYRQTDANAEGCDERGNSARVDSKIADEADDNRHFQYEFENVKKRFRQRFIGRFFSVQSAFFNSARNEIDDTERNEQHEKSDDDFNPRGSRPIDNRV